MLSPVQSALLSTNAAAWPYIAPYVHVILGAHTGFFGQIDGLLQEVLTIDEKNEQQVAEIEKKIAKFQAESNDMVNSLLTEGFGIDGSCCGSLAPRILASLMPSLRKSSTSLPPRKRAEPARNPPRRRRSRRKRPRNPHYNGRLYGANQAGSAFLRRRAAELCDSYKAGAMTVTQSESIYSCRSAISGSTLVARRAGM
jgi:hypothetical protein